MFSILKPLKNAVRGGWGKKPRPGLAVSSQAADLMEPNDIKNFEPSESVSK